MMNSHEQVSFKKLNVLIWCDGYVVQGGAQTVNEHIHSFVQYSKHNIWLCESPGDRLTFLDLTQFDVIVFHYSLYLPSHHYIGNKSRDKIRNFPAGQDRLNHG